MKKEDLNITSHYIENGPKYKTEIKLIEIVKYHLS